MTTRILGALRESNLLAEFGQKFIDEKLDDSDIEAWLEDPVLLVSELEKIIPTSGQRSKFLRAFKGQRSNGNSEDSSSSNLSNGGGNVRAKEPVPGRTLQPEQIPPLPDPPSLFSLPLEPAPVQIMDFVKDKKIRDGKMVDCLKTVLFLELLTSILGQAGRRPVAVLSIAGPSRRGKSFLLGFMLRYLKALENAGGPSDWMGWRNPEEPLKGFSWRNGFDRETSGIWMWSKPFILKSCDGREYAVVLMDTQGVFDDHTNQREWSTIVGLSLLTSSCLIFNIFTDLQEDSLLTLENFMSFGLLAVDNNGNPDEENSEKISKPFQKLCFLIRDFNNPDEFPYGEKGGARYLARKLEIADHHTEDHRRVRRLIPKCFDSLDCFLLPEPGEVARSVHYSGCLSGLTPKFATNVEKFITTLLNPDEFPCKIIGGNLVRAQELVGFFESYVKIFNSNEIPEPKSLFEVTKMACNAAIVEKCVDCYKTGMDGSVMKQRFFWTEDLQKIHQKCLERAHQLFKSSRKMGTRSDIDICGQKKEEQILKIFQEIQTTNSANILKLAGEAGKEALAKFRLIMEEYFKNANIKEDDCLLESSLLQILQAAKTNARDQFFDTCDLGEGVENPPVEFANELQHLDGTIGTVWAEFENGNQLKKANSEKNLQKDVNDLLTSYRQAAVPALENKYWTPARVKSDVHEKEGKIILDKFHQKRATYTLYPEFQENLKRTLDDTELENLVGLAEKENSKILLKLEKAVSEAGKSYRDKMAAQTSDCLDEAEFQNYHQNEKKEVLVGFQNFIQSIFPSNFHDDDGDDENVQKTFYEKLDKEIQSHFKDLESSLKHRVTELYHKISKIEQEATSQYTAAMETFVVDNGSKILVESDLETKHSSEESRAVKFFRDEIEQLLKSNSATSCSNGSHDLMTASMSGTSESSLQRKIKESLLALETHCQNFLDKLQASNKLQREADDSKARNQLSLAQQNYRTEIQRAANDGQSLKQFGQEDAKAREKSRQLLQENVAASSENFRQTLVEQLEDFMLKEYNEALEFFNLKQQADEVTVQAALQAASRFYADEMETQFRSRDFIPPSDFAALGEEILEAAISNCRNQVNLSTGQEKQLREAMRSVYLKFEEDNILRSPQSSMAIGIDLGTTYSCVAVYLAGQVKIIPNSQGKPTTPSYVAFNRDGGLAGIGDAAKDKAHTDPKNIIFDAKRLIGRKYDDDVVQEDMKLWPFTVINENGSPKIKAGGKTHFPEQVSAHLLKYLKECAENYLQMPVKNAVITVPAYFNDGQRQATKDAGRIAGLNVLKIINEPTAAAMAYRLNRTDDLRRNVLIFDLGGGTFDVSLVQMVGGQLTVKGVGGDTHLGGEDFDNKMVKFCVDQFKMENEIDLTPQDHEEEVERGLKYRALRRIRTQCEKQKINLSSTENANVEVDVVAESYGRGVDLSVPLSRDEFENLNQKQFNDCIEIVKGVLGSAGMDKGQVDDIVLVGGSTRIPKIQRMLQQFFDGKSLNRSINPDEAVAYGAAIQACLLNGQQGDGVRGQGFSVSDVTPISMGIELANGSLSIIVPKNTPVPCTRVSEYTTARDYLTKVNIEVYEGELISVAADNHLLGKFVLGNIPSNRAGVEPLDVSMNVDEEGILTVTARSRGSGSTADITISTQKGRLTNEDIERFQKNGEQQGRYRDDDNWSNDSF